MSSRHIRGPWVFDSVTEYTGASTIVIVNESILLVNKASGAATAVTLPAPGTTNKRMVWIIDKKGDASSHNITVTPASGTINGQATHVISEDYGGMLYLDNGTEWETVLPPGVSATELGYLNGVTAGTRSLSKAIVVDGAGAIDALTVTTLTAPTIAGTTAHTGRLTTTDGVAGGTTKTIGGLAYAATADSTPVTSTATETAFDTMYAIPANTLKAGTLMKIRWAVMVTAANGTDTGTFKLYLATNTTAGSLAGTAFVTTAATDMTANDIISGETVVQIRTAGTSGTLVASSNFVKTEAASNTATNVAVVTNSTTVNTQAVQTVAVTCTFNSTNAGNSAKAMILAVEVI